MSVTICPSFGVHLLPQHILRWVQDLFRGVPHVPPVPLAYASAPHLPKEPASGLYQLLYTSFLDVYYNYFINLLFFKDYLLFDNLLYETYPHTRHLDKLNLS